MPLDTSELLGGKNIPFDRRGKFESNDGFKYLCDTSEHGPNDEYIWRLYGFKDEVIVEWASGSWFRGNEVATPNDVYEIVSISQ